uniref:Phenylalanine--tRNA ligase beta subunit n=1 Tax=Alvinella pompejana epibiont 7G3 TaxID=244800 RepID=Q6W3K4_9BACT|nr:phenylalanyl-tRNA synthetase beta subunit [Alvinella pompejana epibiont 7G3]
MIVTRTWLNNFIDLRGISDKRLYETFNNIGLEVDRFKKYEIPDGVVVGEVISCRKHPNADKLNLCEVNVGEEILQIVCGASNVVDAKYVAVAKVGAKLDDNFEIKPVKLRGVDSFGMICSSTELGLPKINDGIMILDDSIGRLIIGKELNSYPKIADTIFELELTANRGDCLSIYGVARDLSAALDIPLNNLDYEGSDKIKIGLARIAELRASGHVKASLKYTLVEFENIYTSLVVSLRLGFIDKKLESNLSNLINYTIHTVGVIIRAYDVTNLVITDEKKLSIVASTRDNLTRVRVNKREFSIVGVSQSKDTKVNDLTKKVLLEASYVNPDILVDAVAKNGLETDELYYHTSRGSEPNFTLGLKYITYLLEEYNECNFFDGYLSIEDESEPKIITINDNEISHIIGKKIEKGEILNILTALGFRVHSSAEDAFGVTVPKFRHDIENIYDVTEEIVRIIGINNIEDRPMKFFEKDRLNSITNKFFIKKNLKQRAISASFFETVSYAFCDKKLLQKYGFKSVKDELDIINPITEDLNTLRTTLLINLLSAVRRNINYSKKSIALFEIGTVFDENREEKELFSLVFSGQREKESVINSGKPLDIDFKTFIEKLSSIIGDFELRVSHQKNGLIHPYQSADIIQNGDICGYISKLHPKAREDFELPETFIAELEFDKLMPKHVKAKKISKFQGVYKDISLVVDKNLPYNQIATLIESLKIPILKRYYPIDVYEDASLKDKKSLTIRLFLQSLENTLEDREIESAIDIIIKELKEQYGASLR